MKQKTHKKCSVCEKEFKLFRTTDRHCSMDCKKKESELNLKQKKIQKPINKVSKKQKILNSKYTVLRIQFLSKPENQICFVDDCQSKATTIEHRMGRKGFADQWAMDENIPLIIDQRYFAPCCLFHNLEFENNSELSNKYQLSKIHGGKKGT